MAETNHRPLVGWNRKAGRQRQARMHLRMWEREEAWPRKRERRLVPQVRQREQGVRQCEQGVRQREQGVRQREQGVRQRAKAGVHARGL